MGMMWFGAGALSMGQVKEDGGNQFQKAGNYLEGNEVTFEDVSKEMHFIRFAYKNHCSCIAENGLDALRQKATSEKPGLHVFRIVRGKLSN